MKFIVGSIIIVAVGAVITDANKLNKTEVTTTNHEHITPARSSVERRWTPVFPNIGKKFILTTKPKIFRNFTAPQRSKNTVLKIIPNVEKTKGTNYWKTATTRQPIMKYSKFTVNSSNTMNVLSKSMNQNEKQLRKIEKIERKYNTSIFRKIMNNKDSSEEDSDSSEVNKNNNKFKHHKTWATRFHKIQSKIVKAMKRNNTSKHNDGTTNKMKATKPELSSEEKDDRTEFIFVTSKNMAPKVVADDSDESLETTTVIEKELKIRQTRSINVIEEENLGTTVSGFKFTGKVASLSNDLVFRNINV